MRIAMFGHKHLMGREGGIEIVVSELATRMAARGLQVTCYDRAGHHVFGTEFDDFEATEYKGVRIRKVFTINRRGLAAMTSSVSASVCAAFGPYDVVHIHAEGPAFMCWLPKLTGKRVVCTIHGLDHKRARWGKLASAYIRLGEKSAVRFADEIIVLSRSMQDYFMETYHRKTVYIPNGISRSVPREASEIKAKWGLEKDSYVLFVGRLVPEKGLRYLLRAWEKTDTDKKLVIAGGSYGSETLLNELKALADDRVVFTGFVEGTALEELYSNAYLYVLPSELEGMPLSLLEAMSYGNCCLTSDIPECVAITQDHAATFESGSTKSLWKTLNRLLRHPETIQKYKEGAAEYICGKYNWDDVVEKTLQTYNK